MPVPKKTPKSIYRPEILVVVGLLRGMREATGLNQTAFATKLGRSQAYVSQAERGAVRLDALQLRDWCLACKTDLVTFAQQIEDALSSHTGNRKRR
ncbi:XRE family transcriptional regulator [Dyella monticola]|uniref:XRE family transcriptional regulator n=1 Tax=Dyella monticola TaxID=1927958 RepID=A0A370X1C8_9GAMM|nr:helix-turn-helix transcriptional regulator [Dyella monticola]RDS82214.1 XRE family transcriptional regulator [Dyella monticola]